MTELELVWPRDIFQELASALAASARRGELAGNWADWVSPLLAEAFYDDRGVRYFNDVRDQYRGASTWDDPWQISAIPDEPHTSGPEHPAARFLGDMLGQLDKLKDHTPKRYYLHRLAPTKPQTKHGLAQLRVAVGSLVRELADLGYFEGTFGSTCPDSRDDNGASGQAWLSQALGVAEALWPTTPDVVAHWSEEVLFSMIEALYDAVERPRARSWHDYHDGWDFYDFDRRGGQVVYAWRVNELMDASVFSLRSAQTGEDRGMLTYHPPDAREDLLELPERISDSSRQVEVSHAVSKWRSRHASRQDKRDAVVALAGILEAHRADVTKAIGRRDAGALFQIANQFHLRHRDHAQRSDYPEVMLDWIFWWYLATVELVETLQHEFESRPDSTTSSQRGVPPDG